MAESFEASINAVAQACSVTAAAQACKALTAAATWAVTEADHATKFCSFAIHNTQGESLTKSAVSRIFFATIGCKNVVERHM